jgi:hypothetical protein
MHNTIIIFWLVLQYCFSIWLICGKFCVYWPSFPWSQVVLSVSHAIISEHGYAFTGLPVVFAETDWELIDQRHVKCMVGPRQNVACIGNCWNPHVVPNTDISACILGDVWYQVCQVFYVCWCQRIHLFLPCSWVELQPGCNRTFR